MSVDDGLRTSDQTCVTQQLSDAKLEIEQLEVAVEHRTIIGQAQGILMAQLDIKADVAFDYLKRVSSHTNTKLVDVAEEIARTRALPDVD